MTPILFNEGMELAEGQKKATCKNCNKVYVVTEETDVENFTCPDCINMNNDIASAAVDMKTNQSDELKKALGE